MVDAHCHLYDLDDVEAEMQRCKDAKINLIICNGAGTETNDKAWKLAKQYSNVYATAGSHPEEMASFDEKKLREQVDRPRVVAVGECGLDYYENTTEEEKDRQKSLFRINIGLAKEKRLPLVVHCRKAFEEIFGMVDYDRVQMHCFSGNEVQMQECVNRGWYISVGGIITFKNDRGLREVIKKVPEELLLTETDSPWLSPEPFRGEKNTPVRVKYVLECLAQVRDEEVKRLESKIEENARKLFRV